MNRITKMVLLISLVLTHSFFPEIAKAEESNEFILQLSKMVQKYDSEEYFATMSVTIGEPNLIVDGKEIPIDESGSVAYVENGRTMMPVRGIAEAVGADVSYNDSTQTVTVSNEDTIIAMTIGENEMDVNGNSRMLLTAPQIKKDRTMLPVRDVAEALDCEVEWVQETQTAIFTRRYQTKRVVLNSENVDTYGAEAAFTANGKTVIQFNNISDARKCVEEYSEKGIVAEPDYIRTVHGLSWGAEMIGGDSYHNQTSYHGGSAIVAVIDSGIDYDHEMFKNRVVSGYDFYFNDNYCEDKVEHGTHVASTVLDIAGKNKNIKIMPLKVFGDHNSTSSLLVAEAIRYAADNGADVINMSLGGEYESHSEQEAINYANSKNVAVIASAGNESLDMEANSYSPGGLEGVITVSNVTKDMTLSKSSNYGEGVIEFAAPGTSIYGAKVGGGYCYKSGTSMSSPHVAGVYALVKAVHPEMQTDEITEALQKNAINIGSSKYYGAGLINADKLEQYISKMYFDKLAATDITETNATISGVIDYRGLIPNDIGIIINNEKIYTTRYKDNGSREMHFVCNLNSDAGYVLKAGTTYDVKIFTNQGGHILYTTAVNFTTKSYEVIPEPIPVPEPTPEPEPQPEKSDLKILPVEYPKGEIKQGISVNLSGRIKSDCHITDVRSYILDENKNIIQESSGWTTTATYVIEKSNLDTGLKFEKLNPGNYYLKYYAKDETGNTIEWISDIFKVVSGGNNAPEEPTVIGVVIIPANFENLSVRKGPSTQYDIVGSMNNTVKCNVYTNKTQNGWYYIEYNGIYGYASGNYIYLPSETRTGTVNIPSSWENLSIRTGPSTNYKIVGSINHGKKCTVFTDKSENGWYYIEYNGIYGYAAGNRINLN